ncbi:hypothetical protein FKM82_020387 [Ascaphus truei]
MLRKYQARMVILNRIKDMVNLPSLEILQNAYENAAYPKDPYRRGKKYTGGRRAELMEMECSDWLRLLFPTRPPRILCLSCGLLASPSQSLVGVCSESPIFYV